MCSAWLRPSARISAARAHILSVLGLFATLVAARFATRERLNGFARRLLVAAGYREALPPP